MPKFSAKLLSGNAAVNNQDNENWWESNPMIYDWKGKLGEVKLEKDYFDAIDRIFGEGHQLCGNPRWPEGYILEEFIPYHEIAGKKVLEIGCGAGLVSSHLANAGGDLTAIDLTDNAVKITKKRFELNKLSADIRKMDAEKLSLRDESFDYVISWGVIHHSGNMQAIISEIHRILKPGGKAYIMVYNRDSLRYHVFCRFWLGIIRMRLFRQNLDEIAGSITDGHIARYLKKDEFRNLASAFFSVEFSFSDEVTTTSSYLLGPLRKLLKPFSGFTRSIERWLAKRWGWYMQVVLTK